MLKSMKKVASLLLAVVMIFSMNFAAFAETVDTETAAPETIAEGIAETILDELETENETASVQASANSGRITADPADVSVCANENAVFSVGTSGKVAKYQWQISQTNGRFWTNLSARSYGASDTITVNAQKVYDNALFRCIVTFKDRKTAVSAAAKLTVEEAAPVVYSEGALNYNSDSFDVAISYTEDARIPEGTTLDVKLVDSESEEFRNLWKQTLDKLNETATYGNELTPDTRKGIAAAEFFDISLFYNGQEIEPEAPLQVKITFKNGGLPQFDGEDTKVIHFAENGTEIIDGSELSTEVSDEQMPEGMPDGVLVNDFEYAQDSFSVTGLFTTDEYPAEGTLETEAAPPILRAAGDSINADKTVTDKDGDGIYDLELYVQGNSEQSQTEEITKSNVVIVIDKSNSMNNNYTYSEYTYSASTYSNNAYYTDATSGNNIHRVYHDNQGWYYTTGGSGWWDPEQRHDLGVNAKVYLRRTRMEATKEAANNLVTALLANNDSSKEGHGDIVEIALVTFSGPNSTNQNGTVNDAQVLVAYNSANTTNETQLHNQINSISTTGGTNWEAALRTARTQANNFKTQEPNEQVSVIFLTDGMPTFWVGGGNGREDVTSNVQNSWTNSRDEAYGIATTDKHVLYNIFAYGEGSNYLKALTNYAYGRGGNYNDTADTAYTRDYFFDAKDTSALEAAFEAIIKNISNNVGYAGVGVTDGVNLGATNTSATVGGTVNPEEFTYTVYDGNRIVYSVKFDHSGNTATFTIDGQEYTATCQNVSTPITNADGTVVKTITSKVAKVTVGDVEYKMSPATMNSAGLIEWELAGLGVLPNYKFALSMHVWPNQMAYDIAADMNNEIYPDLDTAITAYGITNPDEIAKIKASIKEEANGSYSVYTNYEQSVRYYEADEETVDGETTTTYGNEQTKPLTQPDPIPLAGSLIPMEKRWGSDLAIVELQELVFGKNGVYNRYKVILDLKKDGTLYKSYEFPKLNDAGLPVDASGNVSTDVTQLVWAQDAAISPGRLVTKDPGGKTYKKVNLTGTTLNGVDISGEYFVIEDGHEYEITEREGGDLHFEFSTDIYHPMLVDGKLMNVKVTRDSSGKIVDGSTVEVIDPDMTSVYATNTLKGGLNIRKVVTKEDKETEVEDCKDEFTFEITLTKDGQPYSTPSDQYSLTKPEGYDDDPDHGGWSYDEKHNFYYKSGFSAYNIYDGNGDRIDRSWIPASGKLTLTMPADGEIRVVNLPTGTVYTVKEVLGEGGEYQYIKTVSAIKYGEDEDGNDLIENDPAPVTTTDNTVTGSIRGNKANLEVYYNWASFFFVYHSGSNKIEKISFADERVTGTYNETDGYVYTFDMVAETGENGTDKPLDNVLYGGYYKAYSGAKDTNAQILAGTYTDGWMNDAEGAAPYDANTANVWKKAEAYTDTVTETGGGTGTAMTPKSNVVYYLKEVPNGYIRPYIHFTYDDRAEGKPLKRLYSVTAADDVNYSNVGYIIDGADEPYYSTTRSLAVTIKKPDGTNDAILTAKSIWAAKTYHGESVTLNRGYLYWADFSTYIGKGYTMRPCWTTLDKVLVKGVTLRTVNNGTSGTTIGVEDVKGE